MEAWEPPESRYPESPDVLLPLLLPKALLADVVCGGRVRNPCRSLLARVGWSGSASMVNQRCEEGGGGPPPPPPLLRMGEADAGVALGEEPLW